MHQWFEFIQARKAWGITVLENVHPLVRPLAHQRVNTSKHSNLSLSQSQRDGKNFWRNRQFDKSDKAKKTVPAALKMNRNIGEHSYRIFNQTSLDYEHPAAALSSKNIMKWSLPIISYGHQFSTNCSRHRKNTVTATALHFVSKQP